MASLGYWQIFLLILGSLTLLPYLLGPVLIRFSLRQSGKPEVHTFDSDDPLLPEEVVEHYRRVTAALLPEGFELVAGLALPNPAPRVKALILMLVNRRNQDAAIASAMYADLPQGARLQTVYVEFVSRFRDRSLVQTNNSEEFGAFAPLPGKTTTQFPMVRGADQLYRLHQALAQKHASASGKILRLDEEFHGDAVAYLSHALVEELDSQIGTGYMYFSEQETVYRPTWRGALLMTWGQLWPFKSIRRFRRKQKAERLLAELEGC